MLVSIVDTLVAMGIPQNDACLAANNTAWCDNFDEFVLNAFSEAIRISARRDVNDDIEMPELEDIDWDDENNDMEMPEFIYEYSYSYSY